MLTLHSNLSPTQDRTPSPKEKNGYFEDYLIDDESGDTVWSKFIYTYLRKYDGSMEIIQLIVKTDARSEYLTDDIKEAVRVYHGGTEIVFDCKVTLLN
jgi:hypothetical protein